MVGRWVWDRDGGEHSMGCPLMAMAMAMGGLEGDGGYPHRLDVVVVHWA
jgi:hypothetical protein